MIWPTRRKGSARHLAKLLAAVAILLFLSLLAAPGLLWRGHRLKPRPCDQVFHAFDSAIRDLGSAPGGTARSAIAALLGTVNERNPRDASARLLVQSFDPRLPAFTPRPMVRSCQIDVTALGEREALLRQARSPEDEGGGERTYRVSW